MLGNRTSLRHGETETHYRYDAASQLASVRSPTAGTPNTATTASGRLTEEHEDELRRVISYNGFG